MEAIKILINYYFYLLGYQKVNVRIYSFNKECIELHEKLGFTKEGRLRRCHFAMNKFHDIMLYGMTKE
jgi:RimJ/RimL family protein N-acetyltransferase